jgi:antitoxin component of MazEF toxin-antitoxin module
MVKKITKPKDGLTLHIDQAIADELGITQETELIMYVIGDTLIIKPKKRQPQSDRKKQESEERTRRLMEKYDSVLRKLADS